jgi:hypothetical protein
MTILYLILFIAVFPALWLLALYLDRVLPSDSNRSARIARHRREDEEQRKAQLDSPDKPN